MSRFAMTSHICMAERRHVSSRKKNVPINQPSEEQNYVEQARDDPTTGLLCGERHNVHNVAQHRNATVLVLGHDCTCTRNTESNPRIKFVDRIPASN